MISIYQYATNLISPQPPIALEAIKQEMRIDATFRKIMSTPMSDRQREQELALLMRERASLIQHVPAYGKKGSVIFFNLKLIGLAPTPSCPAYNKMRVPTISLYEEIGSNIAIIRLDKSAMQYIPKQVLEKMGDLSRKKVDIFWTAIDGRTFIREDRSINLCTHPWSHPYARDKEDVRQDVNMGIFPEIGFTPCKKPGAIAFHGMSPMHVHTHFGKGAMLYSPDNAHLEAIPGSPFGIFWAATEKDGRVALTKTLVIFDYAHPISQCLIHSIRECGDLSTHLKRLAQTKGAIQEALTLPEQGFMSAFDALPLAFQYGIYFESWLLFDSPRGIHSDFGKASFKRELSLKEKFHCSQDQRKQAVTQFARRLENLLIDSQIDLTLHSQPLQKGDNVLRMMRCAQLFAEADAIRCDFIPYDSPLDRETRNRENLAEQKRVDKLRAPKETEAMDLFREFSKEEKEAVFSAVWELMDCPREDAFGTKVFLDQKTPFSLKSRAVLLAASLQVPLFEGPFTQAAPRLEIVQPQSENNLQNSPDELTMEQILEAIANLPNEVEQPQVPPFVETECTPPNASAVLTPLQVLQAMMNLAFSDHFIELSPDERKVPVKKLFDHLPLQMKNNIYGKVYDYSNDDTRKGVDGWGESHFADDLNVLIDALHDVLG